MNYVIFILVLYIISLNGLWNITKENIFFKRIMILFSGEFIFLPLFIYLLFLTYLLIKLGQI